MPQADIILVLVNTPTYGGAGGAYGVFYRGTDGAEVMLHELGHSFGLLADEYEYDGPAVYSGAEPSEPNVTVQTARSRVKWGDWVAPTTPLPTTTTAADVPGLYEGAKYSQRGIYRPTYNSKMRTLYSPFDRVNNSLLTQRIFDFAQHDTTPPSGSIIQAGQLASDGLVPLALNYSDSGTYVSSYQLSNYSDFRDSARLPASNAPTFSQTVQWQTLQGTGTRTVWVRVTNGSGQTATQTLTIQATTNTCTITGTSANDALTGTAANDVICGLGGNDTIKGQGGNDTIVGGPGTDKVDYTNATVGVKVNLTTGTATGQGTDTLKEMEVVDGSPYADTIDGDALANQLAGKAGNDKVFGQGGTDTVWGGDGTDTVGGGGGDDRVEGGNGVDTATFGAVVTADLTTGSAVGQGSDTLVLVENLRGSAGNDRLRGSSVANTLEGGSGNDTLIGEGSNDKLYGAAGNDSLTGGLGTDTCDGGADSDTATTCETKVSIP